jgi:hypothetical protein
MSMQFEDDLWEAINRYAISVGGDPASHVYDNVSRMQAVADVGKIVARDLQVHQDGTVITPEADVERMIYANAFTFRFSELISRGMPFSYRAEGPDGEHIARWERDTRALALGWAASVVEAHRMAIKEEGT